MAVVRVRPGVHAACYVEALGAHVPLNEGEAFDDDDPVVKEHAWAFTDDPQEAPKRPKRSVRVIETAADNALS